MITLSLTIPNALGLHARASSKLVELARRYQSDIMLDYNEQHADAKSILAIMMLGAPQGSTCICNIEGEDENEAAEAISTLFQMGFHDPEYPADT